MKNKKNEQRIFFSKKTLAQIKILHTFAAAFRRNADVAQLARAADL